MSEWIIPEPDPQDDGRRYHMTDFVPFSMPDSLDDLHGTEDMVFDLPVTVYWGPRRPPFDMRVETDVIRAYTELVSHAGPDLQEKYLNRRLLIRTWNSLFLDRRHVRPTWEKRFPELGR